MARPRNPIVVAYAPEPYEWVRRPLDWQLAGLTETASGYGQRLTSTYCVRFPDGRERRVYITQYSNAGSAWIVLNGTRHYLRESIP